MDIEYLKQLKFTLDLALRSKKDNEALIKAIAPEIIKAIVPVFQELITTQKQSKADLLTALSNIVVNVPETKVPEAKVTVTLPKMPSIEVPMPKIPELSTIGIEKAIEKAMEKGLGKIKIPKPEITVKPTDINIPETVFPSSMEVTGEVGLKDVDTKHPLPVRMVDAKGKDVAFGVSMGGGGGGGVTSPDLINGIRPPTGSTVNGSRVLTLANTWYSVPSTIPTSAYAITVTIETTVGTIRWGRDNAGTPSATNGNLAPGELHERLPGGRALYYASSTANDQVNWTTVII